MGVLLMGGKDSTYSSISSTEVIGLDNCSVPDLPEWRYNHGSFVTGWGSLAVCGGWWGGKPFSSDCLVLNTTIGKWERGVLGNVLGNYVRGVISLDVGTYIVHRTTSSFLPSDEREWVAGPNPPDLAQCATGISSSSFLVFGGKTVRQYDSSIAGKINVEGWINDREWPNLLVDRRRPGCATLDDMCIVAGGRNELGEVLKSVEIIFLTSHSLGKAEDMLTPRENFNLIVLGTLLLAIGGVDETSMETWEGVDGPWKEASTSLANSRSHFSALKFSDQICSDGSLNTPLPGTLTVSPSQKPTVMWLIGGKNSKAVSLSSIKVIGLDNCSVPDLPETRFDHGSFMTGWGFPAVCGGWWANKPWSSDCLVLNTTSKQWERGLLGNLLGDYVRGVISFDIGTFMVHPTISSFLPSGEREWVAGPNPPDLVQCATGISASSFLVFGGKSVRQYDSSIAGPSSADGWSTETEWPDLEVERYIPACATIDALCIVAGGRNEHDQLLKSVEIIFLTTKEVAQAEDMLKPRDHFNLIVLGTTLMAFGGVDETSMEIWEGVGGPWITASTSLENSRSQFSVVSSSDLVCPADPYPPHSCPTVDGGTCVFPFRNGKESLE